MENCDPKETEDCETVSLSHEVLLDISVSDIAIFSN